MALTLNFDLNTSGLSDADMDGVKHTVEVTASTLYEAAVMGLRGLRSASLVPVVLAGLGGKLTVEVRPPLEIHELPIRKLHAWLDSAGKISSEQAMKSRLREILQA